MSKLIILRNEILNDYFEIFKKKIIISSRFGHYGIDDNIMS